MKSPYHLYKLVEGKPVLLEEGSVRFSRANRRGLRLIREGHKNVFFSRDPEREKFRPSVPRLRSEAVVEKLIMESLP